MKKLFIAALSTFLALGLAACGGTEKKSSERTVDSFSDAVIKDGDEVYGMVGPGQAYIDGEPIAKPWGEADGSFGLAEAVSLRDVASRSIEVAEDFEAKGLKGLYRVDKVELGHQAVAGYLKGAYNEKGEYVEKDGVFTVKFAHYAYDDETEKYAIATWIPSPEAYSESLTPETFWAPIHQEAKDENGLAHDSDAVNIAGAGEYTYYLGVYEKAVGDSYFGIAVFQDKALSDYVAPADQVIYSLPGGWNSWNNAAEMTKVSDTEYRYEVVVESLENGGNAGRITKTGTWDTVAGYTEVTTGADLVESQAGSSDNNFAFLALGTYAVTLNLEGETASIAIVAQE